MSPITTTLLLHELEPMATHNCQTLRYDTLRYDGGGHVVFRILLSVEAIDRELASVDRQRGRRDRFFARLVLA